MKTLTETIPTVFNPESAFVLSLQNANDIRIREDETLVYGRFLPLPEDKFMERGIPQSAIHD